MDSNATRFPYILDNLQLSVPNILWGMVWLVILIFMVIFIRYALLYLFGLKVCIEEHTVIENKKKILGDLIIMKDIQTELEAEIEQAMLKSTFQQ